ncbi:hypothetical protein K504DRAFT_418781, partial [Pleomassaria siparia CBS 279.74]
MTSTTHRSPGFSRFNDSFISRLESISDQSSGDDPNYWSQKPATLNTTSTVHSFETGTGSAIFDSLSPLLESTNQELILVTCFWARSSTLETLNNVLRRLSDKAVRRGTEKIRVRLCFSSLSLFQKLFHSQSVKGQTYPSSVWVEKLGLPPASELNGLDIQIKSVFILPFSVMHPKFMIIDRMTVILPSCNISWEEWFEGCITFSGPIVDQFLEFYTKFWHRAELRTLESPLFPRSQTDNTVPQYPGGQDTDHGHAHITTHFASLPKEMHFSNLGTVFLPSPHRRNPRFNPFIAQQHALAPPTPLNTFVLTLFSKASKCIRIQTPNITAPPVLSALLKALSRGIDVNILTSEKLMILEQLVTAGCTTTRCIRKLVKRYRILSTSASKQHPSDEEHAIAAPRLGRLQISYFEPRHGLKRRGEEAGEPQQSHFKMMVVDNDTLILGSGNLDRASWFTSQELGVSFSSKALVSRVLSVVDEALVGRTKLVFDSG